MIGRKIAENVYATPLMVNAVVTPILEPRKNQVVFLIRENGTVDSVQIISGQWWGTYGLSNFWKWKSLTTGREESGYGDFYKIEVEVRHGRWDEVEIEYAEDVDTHPDLTTMRCDKCNRYHTTIFYYGNPTEMMHYCPNCGARMDGGADDADD